MYSKQQKLGLLIIIIGLIGLILLIYFTFFTGRKIIQEPIVLDEEREEEFLPEEEVWPVVTPADRPRDVVVYDISQEEPHQVDLNDASSTAIAFANRLGSFSNHSGFSNVIDAQSFMTPSLINWSNNYIERLKEEYPVDTWYEITTYAFSTQVIENNEERGEVEIRVQTRRQETIIDEENTFNQDMIVNLIKDNNRWLVNAVYWQD